MKTVLIWGITIWFSAFNEKNTLTDYNILSICLENKLEKINNFFYQLHVSGTSARNRSPSTVAMELFEQHQGTHILQVRH